MNQVYLADHFLCQLKFYLKKYRNLEKDLIAALQNFTLANVLPMGRKFYKVRLKSSDIPKGKSKSFRLIVFLLDVKNVIVPIALYFKGERQNISEKEIEYHLAKVLADVKHLKYLSK